MLFDAEKFLAEMRAQNEKYHNLTKEEFAKLRDEQLIDASIVWVNKFNLYFCSDEDFDKIPESIKNSEPIENFLAVMTLDGEVANGGFNQFYYNDYGDFGGMYKFPLLCRLSVMRL
jgi:hypothetical protein